MHPLRSLVLVGSSLVLLTGPATSASPRVAAARWGGAVVLSGPDPMSVPPTISANGRYVTVPEKRTWTGALRLDRSTGAGIALDTRYDGGLPATAVTSVVLVRDGSLAFFVSADTKLVRGDTNGRADVFLRRFDAATVELVVRARDGGLANGDASDVTATEDGRYVAFTSRATNLVPGDTNGVRDVFVRDRWLGTTTRVSTGSDGRQLMVSSTSPRISADGRYVAMLTGGGISLKDRTTGARTLMSVDTAGRPLAASGPFAMSADARVIAFTSGDRIHVRQRTNATTTTLPRRAVTSTSIAVSPDGRFVDYVGTCIRSDCYDGDDTVLFDRWLGTSASVVATQGGASMVAARDGTVVLSGYSALGVLAPDHHGTLLIPRVG